MRAAAYVMTQFIFEPTRTDKWNNEYVLCPVCEWEFGLDGIRKHILTKARSGDVTHRKWMEKHPWDPKQAAISSNTQI